MQVSMYGPHSFASCSDGARVSDSMDGKLQNGMARPPSFTCTFSHFASVRMFSRHTPNRSGSLPA